MEIMSLHGQAFHAATGLLERADVTRVGLSAVLDEGSRRSELGQFMTPSSVASFMASMFDGVPATVKLLDPGAGFGALTAAFVHAMCARSNRPREIEATVFEVERDFSEALRTTLQGCTEECDKASIKFRYRLVEDDFILNAATPMFSAGPDLYDCVILNPPYSKIPSNSKARKALRNLGIETSNLYTGFTAIAIKQLRPDGQLVGITPRSFCNGPYFQPFRKFLLRETALRQIHVYDSRCKAFSDDSVLQENVIFRLVKTRRTPKNVVISSSEGPGVSAITKRIVPYSEVVQPNDKNVFVRIVMTAAGSALSGTIRQLPCTLKDLDIGVSTGRVVDFRAKNSLRLSPGPSTVPLIYPAHFDNGFVKWPNSRTKKSNAIVDSEETATLLAPEGTYVLTKRFSSKEERRRVVAAIYDPHRVAASRVGFENHLNYFHRRGKGLPRALAKGLALFLNSTAVDQYFRQFSGHTQVNATDLRTLNYPSTRELEEFGMHVATQMPSQTRIDELVSGLLRRSTVPRES
jgi:adenine-specific DNA-methyltransferase